MAGYDRGPDEKQNNEILSWILVIVALSVFWPVGLFLLFRKLTEGDRQGRSGDAPRVQTAAREPGTQGVRTVRRREPVRPGTQGTAVRPETGKTVRRRPVVKEQLKRSRGRGMVIGGSIMAAIFGMGAASGVFSAIQSLSWGGNPLYYLEDIFFPLGFCGAGVVLLLAGLARGKKARRFRKYLALIGTQESIAVETLAQAMPVPVHTACDDLQEMLDEGILPTGYLDMSTGRLHLSGEGIREPVRPEPESTGQEERSEDDRILAQIRAVNDAIEDAEMSRKIDRIEEITRKIFAYQKKNPEKGGQLRSFLNYYLPTTLKILNSYAQMEEQGVEGKNITAAKERIEGMMDKVVEGFEKQLDKLFEGTAMDITTDVQVPEQMLEKDGLARDGDGLTLGG